MKVRGFGEGGRNRDRMALVEIRLTNPITQRGKIKWTPTPWKEEYRK